ncbi:MAG: alpha/beta hydrolase-fold protein [Polyangiaceae bacterium]
MGSTSTTTTTSGTGGANGDGDYVISAPFTPDPGVIPSDQVPQGAVSTFTMASSESAVFPTDVATGQPFQRDVAVYVPAQYVPGAEAPFMVVQDGISFYESTMVPALDNLIAAKKIPVMIVVFVEPGPNGGPTEGERSFEYDSVTDAYSTFVESELLPRVSSELGVAFTSDPEGRAAMGGSSGGAAAFTMGWFHPERYRRILTYSGSFCDLQSTAEHPHGAWEYHESLVASTPAKPLRVALEVGDMDLDLNDDSNPRRHWETANKAMAKVLADAGYHYRFVFAKGAGHIDQGVLEQTLPDTLEWLWQGYPH